LFTNTAPPEAGLFILDNYLCKKILFLNINLVNFIHLVIEQLDNRECSVLHSPINLINKDLVISSGLLTIPNTMTVTISNILTLIRFILVPVFLLLFFSETMAGEFFATLAFIAGAITDHYDGKLARRRKEITEFGKFADPLADKFLTLSAFIAIWIREDFGKFSILVLLYIFIIFLRDFGITSLRMWALSKKSSMITSIWAKLKTTFQLITLIAALVYFNARDALPVLGFKLTFINDQIFLPVIHYLILLIAIVTAISGILYLRPSSFEKPALNR